MSQENVEPLVQGLEAWAQQGFSADVFPAEVIHEEVEWDISAYPLPDWPNTGSGREAFLRHLINYMSGWRDYSGEVREAIGNGEEIVVVLHETVSMIDSDTALDRDLHQVFTVRDGAVVRFRVFKTRADALKAIGLSD